MIEINLRLVLVPELKTFCLTFGKAGSVAKQWELTARQTEEMIKRAHRQLVDTTDAMTEFTLEFADYKINLTGVTSKQVFQEIVEYLDKVWNSFKGSRYYDQVYPQ